MNRAILIVICDFIVSAMLSLATGSGEHSSPYGVRGAVLDSGAAAIVMQEMRAEQLRLEAARKALLDAQFDQGFSASRAAAVRELTAKLAQSQARSEMLERKLALRPENSGALTPEQLQKQLEKEIGNRHVLKIRERDMERELTWLRDQNQNTAEKNAQLRETVAARQTELESTRRMAEERARALAATGAELDRSKLTLAEERTRLETARKEISSLDRRATELTGKSQKFEEALSFTRGRLSATEKELAESQSRFERAQKVANTRDLELTEARRQLDNLQNVFKKAVADLSKTRAELKVTQDVAEKSAKNLAEKEKLAGVAAAELEAARTQLAAAEEKLRSDVLQRYAGAVTKLYVSDTERQFLLNRTRDSELFLPLVELGGKVCVIGDFLLLTGNVRDRRNFDQLTDLAFAVGPAEGDGAKSAVKGPLYSPAAECRVGMLEVPAAGRTPLKVMSLSQLKKRGIQDLYLFKHSAFGRESSSLEGRCSVNFADNDAYLYIRNSARGTGSELRAEPGDFVLTKQGDFVAVVVAVETHDFGRRQEARCVVFPDNFDWQQVYALPFGKRPDATYLEGFAKAAQPVLDSIRKREDARKAL